MIWKIFLDRHFKFMHNLNYNFEKAVAGKIQLNESFAVYYA
jgi:hypothetical protein